MCGNTRSAIVPILSQDKQRQDVKGIGNINTDLSGKNLLISRDFYFFGSRATRLPDYLLATLARKAPRTLSPLSGQVNFHLG
jgi:hypothetical protein